MEANLATETFAALSHPGRLAVFRLLMRRVPNGARPTEIAEALGFKANTLSHHLAGLEQAGLVASERDGRTLIYTAALPAVVALVEYLVRDVGRGRPDIAQALGENMAPREQPWTVAFICTANSARSIFAEALLRDLGAGRFAAYSAGTLPAAGINPMAVDVLQRNGHEIGGLMSKPLSALQGADVPAMDFVFTVCDTAASEDCPPWPGQPITGHWGLPDPAKVQGSEAEKALAFAQTYGALRRRIEAFVALPIDTLDRLAVQARVDAIALTKD